MHLVLVVSQGLVDSIHDPFLGVRINRVSYNRLQVQGLRAAFREDETLVSWIQIPKESVLRVQIVEVHLLDREEGLTIGVEQSLVDN